MGPLVYYCRWRGAKLRLHGRDGEMVWGELATVEDAGERLERFRFNSRTWELLLGDEEETQTRLQLDELGVVVADGGRPSMTNAGV